jgi:transcriptional regulator with XRE-family HTH domain
MTQPELAAAIGKTVRMLVKYEKGQVIPPIEVVAAMASALDVEFYSLICPDEEKQGEAFEAYLQSLGYIVSRAGSPHREVELIGDTVVGERMSVVLTADQYHDLQHRLRRSVEYMIWDMDRERKERAAGTNVGGFIEAFNATLPPTPREPSARELAATPPAPVKPTKKKAAVAGSKSVEGVDR